MQWNTKIIQSVDSSFPFTDYLISQKNSRRHIAKKLLSTLVKVPFRLSHPKHHLIWKKIEKKAWHGWSVTPCIDFRTIFHGWSLNRCVNSLNSRATSASEIVPQTNGRRSIKFVFIDEQCQNTSIFKWDRFFIQFYRQLSGKILFSEAPPMAYSDANIWQWVKGSNASNGVDINAFMQLFVLCGRVCCIWKNRRRSGRSSPW